MKLSLQFLCNICALSCLILIMCLNVAICGRDYYDILGVNKRASSRDIKKAFRKLAMQYHPDKNKDPQAEDKFREIAEAYEVLSDEDKRKQYDKFGKSAFESNNGGGFHQGFQFNFNDFYKQFDDFAGFHFKTSGSRGNRRKHGFSFFDFDDLFSDFEPEEESDFQGFGGFQDFFGSQDSFFGTHFRGDVSNSHHTQTRAFSSTNNGRCKTVTQRVGNMVTTYTQCS
ncbi:dnaJ homolog subfamily B member 9-like [Uloborus diversus]|uniref:dnaJ homolog subfamily B member 9-like n=1 Tax=Uloborus diversus TaxID=327109 RepID=UPI00240A880A|nr:dnaJ homolog subfamily B member 9-like [Uloborus diversus]XP_054720001.1 dnaJ homolog subfamily B member 9-like [Uloborus diversus]